MDKVLSARVEESIVSRIGALAHELQTTKKRVIEEAVRLYSDKLSESHDFDIFDRTFGAWKRKGSATESVKKSRRAFQRSMMRHKR